MLIKQNIMWQTCGKRLLSQGINMVNYVTAASWTKSNQTVLFHWDFLSITSRYFTFLFLCPVSPVREAWSESWFLILGKWLVSNCQIRFVCCGNVLWCKILLLWKVCFVSKMAVVKKSWFCTNISGHPVWLRNPVCGHWLANLACFIWM